MFLLVLLSTVLSLVFVYYKWSHQYWARKNFPFLPPSIPFGTVTNPFTRKEHEAVTLQKYYNEMKKRGWKHGGLFFLTQPVYMVVDLEQTKNIMSKDFQHFVDRGFYYNEQSDPLSAHLFNLGGPKWRQIRTKLTPTFTSGKMKMMLQLLLDCEKNLQKKFTDEMKTGKALDIKEISGCFTTDVIGSCAFGLNLKTFDQENSPFRVYGKRIFAFSLYRLVRAVFTSSFPKVAKSLDVTTVAKDISKFFIEVVKDTVSYREKNNINRNDFLQLLINIKNAGEESDGNSLSIEEIAAQCFVFFLAGFETSSTTMTFALYELARHQDIQDKVRKEINTVLNKYDNKFTYEALQDMKYMQQVIDETLRKYPPIPLLTRRCVKDYKLPNEDVIIEKGTMVMISPLGIHYDEEFYPDPEKFDPERFTEENKNKRHHYTHIPFGEGPRLCIGMRFGLMQTKVGLTSLLRNFRFTVNKKTKEPLTMQVKSFVLAAQGEIWLDAEKV